MSAVHDLEGMLRGASLRVTRPRLAVLSAVHELPHADTNSIVVRVREELPNVKHVRGTNFCDIAVRVVEVGDKPLVVVFVAEDNMIKGASGQAVQNMNIVFEQEETAGLL